MEIFVKGPHRIAVTDDSNHIVHILTQTNIISWLAEDTTRIGLKAEIPAKKFMQPVVSVYQSTLAIDAFRIMSEKGLTSLAVVQDGILVGTLSASDLKVRIAIYSTLSELERVPIYAFAASCF